MKFENMINTITLGDSYQLIKDIPNKSIDLVYIDIPYLFNQSGGGGAFGSKNMKYRKDLIGIKDGIDYSILDELVRVMKKINCFVWCSKLQILDILNYFNKLNCNFNILVWCKTNPIPTINNTWLQDLEYCLYFRGKNVFLNDGYNLKSQYFIQQTNTKDKEKYKHPTIKPLELVKRHILHTTQENDIVLDCFSGSGTTCVSAKELNRKFIRY